MREGPGARWVALMLFCGSIVSVNAAEEGAVDSGAPAIQEDSSAAKSSTGRRAERDSWWSLQPLSAVTSPRPDGIPDAWSKHPIDRFVYARMAEKGLRPAAPANRSDLIRRVTYGLTGLPPTPSEIQDFVSDETEGAYEDLIDRLLASPGYGEHWGRHWLDVIRFGESHGYEQNHLRDNAWPFRDYVIRSFNEDTPYDQLVLEHLAGDQVGAGNPEIEVATGFLVAGTHDTVGNSNLQAARQQRANDLDDMVATTGTTFLGLTFGCARCHDHKFDPVAQKDYYGLKAVFSGVRHEARELLRPQERREREARERELNARSETLKRRIAELRERIQPRVEAIRDATLANLRPPASALGCEETFAPVPAQWVRLRILETNRSVPKLDEFEVWTDGPERRNVALASLGGVASASSTRTDNGDTTPYSAALLNDGAFRARWISSAPAPGWVAIRLPAVKTVSSVYFSRDRGGSSKQYGHHGVPSLYIVEVSLDGEAWTAVADSYDRIPNYDAGVERLLFDRVMTPGEREELARLQSRFESAEDELREFRSRRKESSAYVGRFQQPEDPTFFLERGDPEQPGEPISARSPSTLAHLVEEFHLLQEAPEGERRLALARWLVHDKNPLTPRVLANRVWHYHFGRGLVGTPSDFGFNGERPTHPYLLDWLARRVHTLGWRLKPLHREILLSQTYQQASTYSARHSAIDGDAVYLWRFPPRRLSAEEIRDSVLAISGSLDRTMGGPGFRLYHYSVDNVATYRPRTDFGIETYRRAVYHQAARSVKGELLGEYDCPDSAIPAPRRIVTTSPLQALALLNNEFVLEQARAFAARIQAEVHRDDSDAQVFRAFALAFGRTPEAFEVDASRRMIQEHGLFVLCRALLNTNELVHVN